jgi:hypothetical protein
MTRVLTRSEVAAPVVDHEELVTLLREIRDGQQRILNLLEQPSSRPTLTRADRTLLARLLPALGGVYGPGTFSSRDLVEDAAPAVMPVIRGLSVKSIGKLLSRADGIPIDGLLVRRQGVEGRAMAWQVVAC